MSMQRNQRSVATVLLACALGAQACGGSKEARKEDPKPVAKAEAAPQPTEQKAEEDITQGTKRPPITRNPEAMAAFKEAAKIYRESEGKGPIPPAVAERYQAAVAADDKMAVAHYNLGVLAQAEGRLDDAEASYRKALSLDPTLEFALDNLAVILERKGAGDTARKLFQAVIDRNPRAVNARVRLGEMARIGGDFGEALQLARGALAHDPRSLPAYRLLARTYLSQRQTSLAKLMALRGLKIDANDPEMTVIMGEILLAEKDPAAGLATLRKAVDADGSQLKARYQLADAAMDSRDFVGAAQQYAEIVRRDPAQISARHNLALAYQGQGKYANARDVLLETIKAHPDAAEPHFLLADVYMRHMNNYVEAKKELKEFVKMRGSSMSSKHPAIKMLSQVDDLIKAEEETKRQMELLKKQEEEQLRQQKEAEEAAAKAAAAEGGAPAAPAEGAPAAEGGAAQPTPAEPAPGGGG